MAGVAYAVYDLYASSYTLDLEFMIVKAVLIGGVALAFTFYGGIGQADAIALALIAADPNRLSPITVLLPTAIIALAHIGYEFGVGNARGAKTIPMQQFLREQRWIPKAIVEDGRRTEVKNDVNVAREEVQASGKTDAKVEVRYGVPTVAYLGAGYLVYLAYLLLFNYTTFANLP